MRIDPELLASCVFLAGPTACGKTAAALRLAEQLDAEILSMDSMAIYRGMDLGTAKPSREEQARVPHHLIDLVEPHEAFSTAQYLEAADAAIRSVRSAGRIPLFVGGTGLYLRSLLRGVFEGPAADWNLRQRLEAMETKETGSLHRRLNAADPTAAARLHPNDLRRIVRALEVFELTGVPLSEHQSEQRPLPLDIRPPHVYWLNPDRGWARDRIDRRVRDMIDAGLVDEVAGLLQRTPPIGRTARQALGYKEVIDHLEQGVSLEVTIAHIQTRTKQFAKRQCTWFRNLEEAREIPIGPSNEPHEEILRRIG